MKEIHYFLDSIAVQGLSDNTVQSYKRDLEKFSKFLEEQKVTRLQDVDHTTMVLFLQKLKKDEYAVSSTSRMISCLKKFFQFLVQERMVEKDPTQQIHPPKPKKQLPKALSIDEVNRLLEVPDTSTVLGLRDKAMLELLYATGMRVSELISIERSD